MTPAEPRFRLPRSARVRGGREFSELRLQGRRMAMGCLVANWSVLPEGEVSRLGVVTSRKVGGAVVRNRARRLLREVFRLHQNHLQNPVRLVLVARPSIAGRDYAGVKRDFLAFMRRAGLERVS